LGIGVSKAKIRVCGVTFGDISTGFPVFGQQIPNQSFVNAHVTGGVNLQ